MAPTGESAFLDLLSHRYGDGSIYLRHSGLQELYRLAIQRGLISEDGYLTRAGRQLLAGRSYA